MPRKILFDTSERLSRIAPSRFAEFVTPAKFTAGETPPLIDLSIPAEEWHPEPTPGEDHKARLRSMLAQWFRKEFSIKVHPDKEILLYSDIRGALTALTLALVNPGDKVAVPGLGQPVYRTAALFAGAEIVEVPLLKRNDYLPNLDSLASDAPHLKCLFLNYPHNPTGAIADAEFFDAAVKYVQGHNVILVNDSSFGPCMIQGEKPVGLIASKGAKRSSVEFYDLARISGVGPPRSGFAVGSRDIIGAISETLYWIGAGFRLWSVPMPDIDPARWSQNMVDGFARLEKKARLVTDHLHGLGWEVERFKGAPFLWVRPHGRTRGIGFSRTLLRRLGVRVLPGELFGGDGAGHILISLLPPAGVLKSGLERISRIRYLHRKPRKAKA